MGIDFIFMYCNFFRTVLTFLVMEVTLHRVLYEAIRETCGEVCPFRREAEFITWSFILGVHSDPALGKCIKLGPSPLHMIVAWKREPHEENK